MAFANNWPESFGCYGVLRIHIYALKLKDSPVSPSLFSFNMSSKQGHLSLKLLNKINYFFKREQLHFNTGVIHIAFNLLSPSSGKNRTTTNFYP